MTLMAIIFWTLLLVPGFAVARRLVPDELEGGLLPGVAVSWVTAFAMLAPLAIAGYLLHAPMWLAVTVVGGFIVWGGYDLARQRAWKGVGGLIVASIGLELAIVVADMVFSARHGSILAADARVHLARIRFLYDHGLSNLDPFISTPYPYPIYHTNLHHALFATGSKLMGADPLAFWFGSLPAAKLMIASGMAYLAWAVLGGRWAAWIAAVMVLVDRGPVSFSLYPNQLSPWFLMPILIGVLARTLGAAWREPEAAWWHRLPRVAAMALLIGMFHPLYAGFATVIASPVLLGTAGWRLIRRRPGVATALVAWVLVVLCAMPFPFAGKRMTVKDRDRAADIEAIQEGLSGEAGRDLDDRDDIAAADAADEALEVGTVADSGKDLREARERKLLKARDGYVITEWGEQRWVSRELGRGFTGAYGRGAIKAWRVIVVLVGFTLAVVICRRREAWYLLAAIAVVQGIVLTPPVCTMALRFLGADWMLERFETVSFVLFYPLSMPAIAAAIEWWFRSPGLARRLEARSGLRRTITVLDRGRVVLTALTLLAIPLAMAHATHRRPYDWEYYWNRVSAPVDYRHGREYRGLERLQRFLQANIPAGSVVAVEPFTGTRLKMLHDLSLVASERSSTGVADGGRRRIDIQLMFALDTEEVDRAALFEKYGVTHYVSRGGVRPWIDWWDAEMVKDGGYVIATLAEEPDVDELWRRRLKQGVRLLRAERYHEAAEMLQEVVQEDPRLERAWFHLGTALLGDGDAVAAAEAFEQAESLDPEDIRHPLLLGEALYRAERFTLALDAFDRAAKTAMAQGDDGQAATATFNLGNTWYMLDHLEDAIAAYDRAIELDERYDKAREYREIVMEILAERRSEEADASDPDQSDDAAGRPASEDENTPSARPTP